MSGQPDERVVVTGIGVVAPNGNGVGAFREALSEGRSGVRRQDSMIEHNFACQVAATPVGADKLADETFGSDELLAMNHSHRFASLASVEAWLDAGFEPRWILYESMHNEEPFEETRRRVEARGYAYRGKIGWNRAFERTSGSSF